jgi:hypothetical protein
MSMDDGDHHVVKEAVAESRALLEGAKREARQLQFLDPLSADEIQDAQAELGPLAGQVAVARFARESRGGGRPKGVRNRRTEDFRRYIMQFGTDPAVTLMQISALPPEELMARSHLLDPAKRRMSYADAVSLKVRCAEALMPFIHAKQPVATDAEAGGDFNLLIPGLNITPEDAAAVAKGEFIPFADFIEVDDEDEEPSP